MRAAVLIVGGNVVAFALGAVITVWLLAVGLPPPPAPRAAALTSLEKPRAPAPQPQPAPPPAAAAPAADVPPPAAPAAAAVAASPPSPAPAPAPAPAPPPAPAPATVFTPVAPAPAAPPPPPPAAGAAATAAPATAGYVLQLGAFQDPANAAKLQAAIRKAGYPADIVPARSGGRSWQLVRIGVYPTRESAAAAAASLQRDTGVAALIMKPPLQ